MYDKLTEKLNSFLEIGTPGYDCIVYKDGRCVYRKWNGLSNIKYQKPITDKEIYNIYSCSKIITCTAALQLFERGFFKLEDNLGDYMPEFKEMHIKKDGLLKKANNQIRIKDLFCMTAGFSYNLNSSQIVRCKEETKGMCQTRKVMEYLAKEPLDFEPGERWQYSLCHDVLAALIEVLTGIEFNQYVTQNIFNILGMKNTTFLLKKDDLHKVSTHYVYDYKENKAIERSKIPDYKFGEEYASGGAGCVSTVDDYIKFLEAIRKGNVILKKETVDLMSVNQLNNKQITSFPEKDYGYGLGVRCTRGDDGITDFGWGGAAGAYYFVDRAKGISAFYAQHILNSPAHSQRAKLRPIIKELF